MIYFFGLIRIALALILFSLTSVQAAKLQLLIMEGDSLTYGQDTSATGLDSPINGAVQKRSVAPYPESLEMQLGRECVKVINHGFPGDRTVDGLVRWQDSQPGDVFFIMYGTNDAINAGRWPTGILNLETYYQVLRMLVDRRIAMGARVILMSPPPVMDKKQDLKLNSYRDVARKLAKEKNIYFVDVAAVLSQESNIWVDGLHFSASSNKSLSQFLSKLMMSLGYCAQSASN